MATPLSGGVRRKNRQLSRWRFFYARSTRVPMAFALPKSTRTY
jgi:hypothetical protein